MGFEVQFVKPDVKGAIDLHRLVPDAHHEVVTKADVDGRVGDHNNLLSPHALATSIGGRAFGLGDGDLAVLPTAIEGQVLRRGVNAWEAGDLPAGGGDFNLVTQIDVTTALDTVLIDGLDINKDRNYYFIVNFVNNANVSVDYALLINEDHSTVNYTRQLAQFDATHVLSQRMGTVNVWRADGIHCRTCRGYGLASLVNGWFHFNTTYSWLIATGTVITLVNYRHELQQTNITSFRISASSANGIGVGSRILLYRL